MATIFATPKDLLGAVGRKLGASDWLAIEQPRIDEFARATGDHQWIHVDPERARSGPFGATIAMVLVAVVLLTNALSMQLLEGRRLKRIAR